VLCAAIGGAGPTGVLYLYKERDHGQFERSDLRLIEQYRTFLAPLVDRTLAEATSVEDPTEPHRRDGRFANFLGRSRAIADVLRKANQAANFNDQVLLLGPTGTGKSHLARSIHEASPRANGPFIEVNLTAIPAGLFECELFGVHRNAGVHAERDGFVSLARGGTLFLDEAAEISPELQVKLNQFMSTRHFHAVGDDRQQVADVRLIVATNRNLEDDVQSGKVRADYCYRLSAGHVITLPALNARPEDVPLLMDAIGREYAAANQRPWVGFTPRALVSAMAAAWPGNIRDLQGTVRRGFAETGGLVPIDAPHLFGTPRANATAEEAPRDFLPWMEATHRFKLDYFRRAYLHFAGDRAQIIEALDIRNALFFDYRSQLLDQQLTAIEPGTAPLRVRRPKEATAKKTPTKRGRKPTSGKPSPAR
jgi:Nif-specific regulatory protein